MKEKKNNKNDNPEMLFDCCVIHGEILIFKNISPVLNKILESI